MLKIYFTPSFAFSFDLGQSSSQLLSRLLLGRHFESIFNLVGDFDHVICCVSGSFFLPPSIGKREDPGDEVGYTKLLLLIVVKGFRLISNIWYPFQRLSVRKKLSSFRMALAFHSKKKFHPIERLTGRLSVREGHQHDTERV